MIEKLKYVWQDKELRKRVAFLLLALCVIRLGAHIPIPGLNRGTIGGWSVISGIAGFFDLLSGGSLSAMSVFALSVTPVITASIIVELMTVVIPALKEMAQDGEAGRKKKARIVKYLGLGLALVQAVGTAIMFGRQGYLTAPTLMTGAAAAVSMLAGTAFLVWLGDRITERGMGNGTSFILMVNIISRMPQMAEALYVRFLKGQNAALALLIGALLIVCLCIVVALVVKLEGGERHIPIIQSNGRAGQMHTGKETTMPLKANMAGVIPVIFAQTILSLPGFIYILSGSKSRFWNAVQTAGSETSWFNIEKPLYTIGFLASIFLVFFFAYFYTGISFSPRETAKKLQSRGSTIPGIRPGVATASYLEGVVGRLVMIGAIGLVIVTTLPTILTSAFRTGIALGGTSLIIVSGVIMELVRSIDAELALRHHSGFLR